MAALPAPHFALQMAIAKTGKLQLSIRVFSNLQEARPTGQTLLLRGEAHLINPRAAGDLVLELAAGRPRNSNQQQTGICGRF